MEFENKVILITGASSGIGKELVTQLSKRKVKLAIISRRENLLAKLVNSLDDDVDILPIKCDVSKKEEIHLAYKKIIERFGRIDIAILNAGFSERMSIKNYDSKIAEITFGANFFGIVYWVEQLLAEFTQRKSGMIVGVSSLADSKGYSKSGFYSASKAAATIYLEGLRAELRKYNIKVLTVRPGFVRTPMTDKNEFNMPLIMEPDKAAKIIINGIEKEKRIIQFPWQIVFVTRLIPLLPNRIFEILEKISFKKHNK